MIVLSFDPGETTGWCVQDEKRELDFGQAKGLEEVMAVIDEWIEECDEIVVEDYIILQKKALAHSGSRAPAIQIIGYIKAMAIKSKKPITLYPARLKPIQQKRTQRFPKGAHSKNHWLDAYNHGRWHLIQLGLADSALVMMKKKENEIANQKGK